MMRVENERGKGSSFSLILRNILGMGRQSLMEYAHAGCDVILDNMAIVQTGWGRRIKVSTSDFKHTERDEREERR